MKITIVRHGQTDYNKRYTLQGTLDVPLNEEGENQAKKLSLFLKDYHFDKIYASPLSRALQTAKVINSHHNHDLEVVDDLREIELGQWEGLTWKKVMESDKETYDKWELDDETLVFDGEIIPRFHNRCVKAFLDIVSKHHDDDHILIVSHGGVIRAIVTYILNIDREHRRNFSVENTSITEISYYKGRFVIKTLNQHVHL
ncbi:MAG: histidine phosphatase family protein [Candidatus Izemoplasmataceae bacterium]